MTNTATLQTFDFSGLELRVIMQMGEPWFFAADLTTILGLVRGGRSFQYLNCDEMQVVSKRVIGSHLFRKSPGNPAIKLASESGLYRLIMRSDKPEARKFQGWVTREVLPSIRKTGGYLLNEEARDTAKADDRQAMPLPEGFAQLFAKVLQQQGYLKPVSRPFPAEIFEVAIE